MRIHNICCRKNNREIIFLFYCQQKYERKYLSPIVNHVYFYDNYTSVTITGIKYIAELFLICIFLK